MKIDLKKYLNESDQKEEVKPEPGPAITISREYGCAGTDLAKQFIKDIAVTETGTERTKPWSVINKEVLSVAAKELKVSTDSIKKRVEEKKDGIIDDLFSSFSQYYGVDDKTIHERITDVITHYASKGNVVIIGRGGVCITRHIPRSLHIKLMAPIEWRAQNLVRRKNITMTEARNLIAEMDPKRDNWNMQMSKGKFTDGYFDIIFNRQLMSEREILDTIKNLAIQRGLLYRYA